jgi:undecaprenyl-diphosphatase
MIDKIEYWDTLLLLLLNGTGNEWVDMLMYWISNKLTWIPFYAILLGYLYKLYGWKKLGVLILFIAVLITITDQGSVFIKNQIGRYRPCHNFDIKDQVQLVYDYCGGKYGFISSHAANTFGIAVLMGKLFAGRIKWIMAIMLGWAGVVSYSRIYLGVHYPADVLCGALFGAFFGYFAFLFFNISKPKL